MDDAEELGPGLLAVFAALAAYGVWGPGRAPANGERLAMLDLRVAFTSRIAIHCFFLTALIVLGLVPQVPMLLGVALALLAAEIPLGWLVRSRRLGPAGHVARGISGARLANPSRFARVKRRAHQAPHDP